MNDSWRVLIKLYSQKQVGQVRPMGRGWPPPSPAQVALIFPGHWNHLLSFETLSQATPQTNRISLRVRTWASVVLKLPGESRVLPKRTLSHLVCTSLSLPETVVFLCEFQPQWTAVMLENPRLCNCFGPCVQAPATGSPIWLVSGHPRRRSQATGEGGV